MNPLSRNPGSAPAYCISKLPRSGSNLKCNNQKKKKKKKKKKKNVTITSKRFIFIPVILNEQPQSKSYNWLYMTLCIQSFQ